MPKTLADVQAIVDNVRFLDRHFRVLEKGDGFLIQLMYYDEDSVTGKREFQKARKWYLSSHSTETEVVETCWAAVQRSQLHVAGEHFKYKGFRVYSPHLHIATRQYAIGEFDEDSRE